MFIRTIHGSFTIYTNKSKLEFNICNVMVVLLVLKKISHKLKKGN